MSIIDLKFFLKDGPQIADDHCGLEPSLREMIKFYYQTGLSGSEKVEHLTNRYIDKVLKSQIT